MELKYSEPSLSPVFDGILCSARQHLGQLLPSITEVSLRLIENHLLRGGPFGSLNDRVQTIEPPLPALLA